METQAMNRDETYGQFCDLEASIEFSGKIVLSRHREGYIVSQRDLTNFNSWSPCKNVVKLEPYNAKRYSNMEIYEERSECSVSSHTDISKCGYLCVCVGATVFGYLAKICIVGKKK